MTIYVFGNDIVQKDSLPVKLMPYLIKQFPTLQITHADPTENWHQGEKDIVIIDTVEGIDKVSIFNNLDAFEKQTHITPHDYDVYMDISLMKKIGKLDSVAIIGIPIGKDFEEVFDPVVMLFRQINL